MFKSRDIETIIGASATKVSEMAAQLPIPKHGRRRVLRKFTLVEVTLLTMAELLIRDGFDRNGATAAVSAMAGEIEPMMLDETREAWLLVWKDAGSEAGIAYELVHSKSAGIDVIFQHDQVSILTVRPLAENAMSMILAAKIAENEDKEND